MGWWWWWGVFLLLKTAVEKKNKTKIKKKEKPKSSIDPSAPGSYWISMLVHVVGQKFSSHSSSVCVRVNNTELMMCFANLSEFEAWLNFFFSTAGSIPQCTVRRVFHPFLPKKPQQADFKA